MTLPLDLILPALIALASGAAGAAAINAWMLRNKTAAEARSMNKQTDVDEFKSLQSEMRMQRDEWKQQNADTQEQLDAAVARISELEKARARDHSELADTRAQLVLAHQHIDVLRSMVPPPPPDFPPGWKQLTKET
ncbi:hypothetical protein [Naumannella halotolerans]|uniref:Uncharacterized protein n=1 Tax=Naumannella halotolerans TaxID=993414 RepID=A0A4R7J1R2_9ACTN|nr:hypothetical protein [Naumannella halotolerans]TDT31091.1 hypothetical protein CLV29_2504 [Naumannella halotolerans]